MWWHSSLSLPQFFVLLGGDSGRVSGGGKKREKKKGRGK